MKSLSPLCLALALTACGPGASELPAGRAADRPLPTEHVLGRNVEAEHKGARKRWIEQMHRAAPGVDWRARERVNGRAEQERRNALGRPAAVGLGPASNGASASARAAGTWGEVGSANQAGRMHCAAHSPDGARLYAGSSRGGLWRRDLPAGPWTPIGDNLYGGVHELAVLPGENAGEPDVVVTTTDGGDVRLTRDQGLTWETPAGLDAFMAVRGLAVLEDATRTILVLGQRTSPWNTPGLYRSTDYGRSFTATWTTPSAGSASMWVPRTGPLAATHVWVGHVGKIRLSTDGGLTLPPLLVIDNTSDAAVIAGSEAGGPRIYLALRVAGAWTLWSSTDGGVTASAVHAMTDFWQNMAASIVDPDVVIYGGVEARRSIDGGSSFSKINTWGAYYSNPQNKLHADLMGFHVEPDPTFPGAERWYISTDGGLYESLDLGATVWNLSLTGLGVSQYYSTHTAVDDPSLVVAGAQDQGYQRGIFVPPGAPGSGPSTDFDQLISGDYGHLTSSDGTHDWLYSTYPGFILVHKNAYQVNLGQVSFPSGASHLWLPPVVADPTQKTAFFFLGDRLWRYTRIGVGLNFSHVQHSSEDFSAGSSNYLTGMAFAPTDPQRAYAVTDAGELYLSNDQAVTWTNVTGGAPPEHYFYGNAIAVNPMDADEVVVAGSGYSNAAVLRSTDGGQTWLPEASGLPPTLVYDITWAGDGSGDLYCGTEQAPYHWDRDTGLWTNIAQVTAPITTYWSVETVGGTIVRYGTYGRGIWDYRVEPLATSYCTAGFSAGGCQATLSASGVASATASAGFTLAAGGVEGQKDGLFFFGTSGRQANPWGNGTSFQCVVPPVVRGGLLPATGTLGMCDGAFTQDLNALWCPSCPRPAKNPGAGALVQAQLWYRDPKSTSNQTTSLSDAVEFPIGP